MMDSSDFGDFLMANGFDFDGCCYFLRDGDYSYYVDVYPYECDITICYFASPREHYDGMDFQTARSILERELEEDDDWKIVNEKEYRYE